MENIVTLGISVNFYNSGRENAGIEFFEKEIYVHNDKVIGTSHHTYFKNVVKCYVRNADNKNFIDIQKALLKTRFEVVDAYFYVKCENESLRLEFATLLNEIGAL